MKDRKEPSSSETQTRTSPRRAGERKLLKLEPIRSIPWWHWLIAAFVILAITGFILLLLLYRDSGVTIERIQAIIGMAVLIFCISAALIVIEIRRFIRIKKSFHQAERRNKRQKS